MLAAAGFSADSAIEIDYLNEKARPSTPVPTRTEEIVDVDDNSESDTNDSDSDLSSSSSSSSSSSQAESVDVLEWERTQKKEVARKAILVNPYGMWTYHMFFFSLIPQVQQATSLMCLRKSSLQDLSGHYREVSGQVREARARAKGRDSKLFEHCSRF